MKLSVTSMLLLFLLATSVLMFVLTLVSSFDNEGTPLTKEVPCYDKNNNLIKGIVCEEKAIELDLSVHMWFIIGMALAFITGVSLAIDFDKS